MRDMTNWFGPSVAILVLVGVLGTVGVHAANPELNAETISRDEAPGTQIVVARIGVRIGFLLDLLDRSIATAEPAAAIHGIAVRETLTNLAVRRAQDGPGDSFLDILCVVDSKSLDGVGSFIRGDSFFNVFMGPGTEQRKGESFFNVFMGPGTEQRSATASGPDSVGWMKIMKKSALQPGEPEVTFTEFTPVEEQLKGGRRSALTQSGSKPHHDIAMLAIGNLRSAIGGDGDNVGMCIRGISKDEIKSMVGDPVMSQSRVGIKVFMKSAQTGGDGFGEVMSQSRVGIKVYIKSAQTGGDGFGEVMSQSRVGIKVYVKSAQTGEGIPVLVDVLGFDSTKIQWILDPPESQETEFDRAQ